MHRACPRVLGLDEHRFSRQTRFATTFCDLQQRKVFGVVQGHSGQTLLHYLDQLPAKNRVKLVCMDLSRSYRSLAKQYFPNALIVADRFHVIWLINHACLQTYQQIDPETKHQRGILAILRKRIDNLTELQIRRRNQYFEKQPAVESIYYFQKRLHRLLTIKHWTKKQCRRLIPLFLKMIDQLKTCGFEKLQTLGRTLEEWQEEIARMWRYY